LKRSNTGSDKQALTVSGEAEVGAENIAAIGESSSKPNKKRRLGRKAGRGHGVRWKIFGLLALFTVIILVILWLTQTVFLGDIYRAAKISEIKISARLLTDKLDSEDELVNTAYALCGKGDMCIIVLEMLDADTARVIVSEDNLPNCTIHNIDSQSRFTLYDRTVNEGGECIQSFRFDEKRRVYYSVDSSFLGSNANGVDSIVYSLIAQNGDGQDILILLNSIVTPVAATVNTLRRMLVAISFVLLVIALVFSIFFARSISRPIIALNKSAKRLATGDYNGFDEMDGQNDMQSAGHGGYREIRELADTLSYAASELQKVDNLRRELIANISHDLRTPLTMIEGYAEIMRDLPGENTPENTQIIIDETKRLTTLVNDMLDISKWESGNAELNMSSVNITKSIDELLGRYNKLKADKNYIIRFDYDEPLELYTDETRFIQALYNLVNNAITYTGEDRTVIVRQIISPDRKSVRYTIADSGEGIPPDKLENIWERYYKVDKVHRRASVGTGLGLSIVRNIVTALGGTYGVESTIGKGSTFWFRLPIINPEDQNNSKM